MKELQRIQADLLRFVRERRGGERTVDAATNLLDSSLMDSLLLMDLVLHIQRCFGVSLDASDVTPSNFCDVATLARVVLGKTVYRSDKAA